MGLTDWYVHCAAAVDIHILIADEVLVSVISQTAERRSNDNICVNLRHLQCGLEMGLEEDEVRIGGGHGVRA
jgi:hypothetical protein